MVLQYGYSSVLWLVILRYSVTTNVMQKLKMTSTFPVECIVINKISLWIYDFTAIVADWTLYSWLYSSHTIQSALIVAVIQEIPQVRLHFDSRSLVQCQRNFSPFSVTCNQYPAALKHILQFWNYSAMSTFCLDWKSCSMRLVWLLFQCRVYMQ